MRWKTSEYKERERHVIRKFAFLPIKIKNEVRWLEFVKIKAYYWYGSMSGNIYWEYEEFVD